MSKTTLTLSEPVAKTLKVYTVQTKSSMHAQSLVVEEALREFFERQRRYNQRITPYRGTSSQASSSWHALIQQGEVLKKLGHNY